MNEQEPVLTGMGPHVIQCNNNCIVTTVTLQKHLGDSTTPPMRVCQGPLETLEVTGIGRFWPTRVDVYSKFKIGAISHQEQNHEDLPRDSRLFFLFSRV